MQTLIVKLINKVFNTPILDLWNFDLEKIINEDAANDTPILFASAPGFDPSGKIYHIAKKLHKHFDDVAIGS